MSTFLKNLIDSMIRCERCETLTNPHELFIDELTDDAVCIDCAIQ